MALCALAPACRYGYDPLLPSDDDAGAPADASLADARPVDGSPIDARVPADASPPDAACDPTALLGDTFSSVDPRWQSFGAGGVSAAIVNGRLRVTLSPSSVTNAYGGYVSAGSYDLVGRRLSVEVPSMVDTSGHAQALLQLKGTTAGGVVADLGFEQQHGALHMFNTGSPADATLTYEPTQHRYWQVRESAGTVFFETSPDGAAWTVRFSTSSTFDLSRIRITLTAGRYQQETALGFAEFDNLGGTVALGVACKGTPAPSR